MTTYFLNILQGLLVTIGVALGALVVATLLGLAGAAAKLSPFRPLNWLGDIYSTVIRGVPDLVWMLLLYFGGQILVNDIAELLGYRRGPQINPFVAGVLTIGFVYGAYMTETFRGAIMSVPKGQSEAGWAYGMSRFYTFRRMVLPQMVRFTFDVGNFRYVDRDSDEAFDRLADTIAHVHLKDLLPSGDSFDMVPLGEGEVDNAPTIRKLIKRGYTGCIAIECGGQGADLEDARKSVEFVKDVLAE